MTVLSACKKCWFVLLPVFLVAVAVVIILPFYLKELKQQNQNSNPTPEEHAGIYTTDTSDPAIRKLTNLEYNFSFEYPSNSGISHRTRQPSNSQEWNQAIEIGAPGEQNFHRLATVYVWKNEEGLGLMEWVALHLSKQTGETGYRAAPSSPNARIAGEDALFYEVPSQQGVPGRTTAIFSYNRTIVLIESGTRLGQAALSDFEKLLGTFEFDGKTTEDVIPPPGNN